jgi:hypothetical protein
VARFYRDALGRIAALPGVVAAGATTQLPLNGGFACVVYGIESRFGPSGSCAELRVTTPGYAEAAGIPVLAGRYLSAQDGPGSLPVAVVSQSMAALAWPGASPLGQRIRTGSSEDSTGWRTVIGVIGDVHHKGLGRPIDPEFHIPHAQMPSQPFLTLAVRTGAGFHEGAVRDAIWSIDPDIPVPVMAPMSAVIRGSVRLERLRSSLIGILAVIALGLAAVGVSAVASCAVNERRREIGIRMALGAAADRVWRMVVGQSLAPVALGLLAGVPLAWAAARAVRAFLFGTTPGDPVTAAVVSAVLLAAATAGTLGPARRAVRRDLAETLRDAGVDGV